MGKSYTGSAKIGGPFDSASTATTVLFNRKAREKDSAYRNATIMLVVVNFLLLFWLVGAEVASAAIQRLMIPGALGIWFVGIVFLSNIVLHIVTVAMDEIRRGLLIASLIHNAITWFMFPAVLGIAISFMIEDSWGTEQQCQQFSSLKVMSLFVPNGPSLILSTMKCCMCGVAIVTFATHIVLEIRYLYKSIEVRRQAKSAAVGAAYTATGMSGRRTGASMGGSRTNIASQATGPTLRLQLQEPAHTGAGSTALQVHAQPPAYSPLNPNAAIDGTVYENTAVAVHSSKPSLLDPSAGAVPQAAPEPPGVSVRATGYRSVVPGFVPGLSAAPVPTNARVTAGYRNPRPY